MSHSSSRERRKRDRDVGGKGDGRIEKTQHRKPRAADHSSLTSPPDDFNNRQMYDRTVYATMNLVGRVVQVQVKSGEVYEGIFHTACTEKGFGVVLKMARKKDSLQTPTPTVFTTTPVNTLIVQPKDFVQLIAKDVTFDDSSDTLNEGFHTDSDISGHNGDVRERELMPWVPDGEEEELEDNLSLSNIFSNKKGWDQFEVNEKLFGVKSTYKEDIYTTALDRNSQLYLEKEQEAQRIADEIEKKVTTNIHLAEERGQSYDEDDIDEEERYSSVIRSHTSSSNVGKYIPPAKRAAIQAKQVVQPQGSKTAPQSQLQASAQIPADTQRERSNSREHLYSSTEELGAITMMQGSMSPKSPTRSPARSPLLTPISPGMEKHPMVAERLRLRLHLVNERLKNTAPVPSTTASVQTKKDFPETSPRSPLLSPLVGDPKTINALNLEPCTPNIPENVVRDFLEFSLTEKAKQQSREAQVAELKSFSRDFNLKRGSRPNSPLPNAASQPSATPISTSASPLPTPQPTTPPTPTVTPVPISVVTPPSQLQHASSPPEVAPSNTSRTTPTSISSSSSRSSSSKLNPNAKIFTPMSAAAPVFTPKGYGPAPALIPPPDQVFFHPAHPITSPALETSNRHVVDISIPISDIYCDSMKRKQTLNQESSEMTPPYWYGPRGTYRASIEEEAFFFAQQHAMPPHQHQVPQPRQPPLVGGVGMVPVNVGGNMFPYVNMNVLPGVAQHQPPISVNVNVSPVSGVPMPPQATTPQQQHAPIYPQPGGPVAIAISVPGPGPLPAPVSPAPTSTPVNPMRPFPTPHTHAHAHVIPQPGPHPMQPVPGPSPFPSVSPFPGAAGPQQFPIQQYPSPHPHSHPHTLSHPPPAILQHQQPTAGPLPGVAAPIAQKRFFPSNGSHTPTSTHTPTTHVSPQQIRSSASIGSGYVPPLHSHAPPSTPPQPLLPVQTHQSPHTTQIGLSSTTGTVTANPPQVIPGVYIPPVTHGRS
jgi:hypothetical protein